MHALSRKARWLWLLAQLPREQWGDLAQEMRARSVRVWEWEYVAAPRLLGA
jgi:hypothetical protein